jgi:hypothetical protein
MKYKMLASSTAGGTSKTIGKIQAMKVEMYSSLNKHSLRFVRKNIDMTGFTVLSTLCLPIFSLY